MTFPHNPQPGPRPGPPAGGFRPPPPPRGGFRPAPPPPPGQSHAPGQQHSPGQQDSPGQQAQPQAYVAPAERRIVEETGHPAVDAVLRSLANAAELAPGEQIAAYEAAHQ